MIERPVFDALHEAAGLSADWPVGPAGVLHVYGYWFSGMQTPFCLNRNRCSESFAPTLYWCTPTG